MSTTNSSKSTRYLVQLAVLVAILLILEFTGLGLIKTPMLEFTVMQVPVIIGAIIMGPMAGGILGGVFGMISFWECVSGKSAFGAMLLSINPAGTFVVCVPTRILMGILCGLIFLALRKPAATRQFFSFGIASLCGALLNTAFFMSMLMLFFYQTDYIQSIIGSGTGVLAAVWLMVGIQGILEAVICAVVGTAVTKALFKAQKL